MVGQIDVETLQARLLAGDPTVLVDVREPWEHAYCHLPDSQLMPLGELDSHIEGLQVPDGALVVVYCHHGVRSLHGAAYLNHCGVTAAVSLRGGIDAWSLRVDPRVPRY